MHTLVIVDDMQNAREVIASIIKKNFKNVTVVAAADSVQSGVHAIKEHKPDIVLLDIQMHDGSGFDILNKLKPYTFKVIFISAYEEHALKAFKFSALDYVLKPIDSSELIIAIQKAEASLLPDNQIQSISVLENNYSSTAKESKKIVLKTSDSIFVVNVKDILRCEADENYTTFFLQDKQKILISKPLKEYDELLTEFGFFRVHQSHLINLDYFKQYKKADGGFAIMTDGSAIPVSSRKKDLFLKEIEKF
jgi:two-component system LytT family response regulator